jgi:hypothetical protein
LNSPTQFFQHLTEGSIIDGVASRQKIDEKWLLLVPEDGCHDFSVLWCFELFRCW